MQRRNDARELRQLQLRLWWKHEGRFAVFSAVVLLAIILLLAVTA